MLVIRSDYAGPSGATIPGFVGRKGNYFKGKDGQQIDIHGLVNTPEEYQRAVEAIAFDFEGWLTTEGGYSRTSARKEIDANAHGVETIAVGAGDGLKFHITAISRDMPVGAPELVLIRQVSGPEEKAEALMKGYLRSVLDAYKTAGPA